MRFWLAFVYRIFFLSRYFYTYTEWKRVTQYDVENELRLAKTTSRRRRTLHSAPD